MRQHRHRHVPGLQLIAGAPSPSPAAPETPSLTVALLCHNELANLQRYLPEVERFLQAAAAVREVVVVDDGSEDGTAEWLAGRRGPVPLRVLRHGRRRGYGAAVRTAIVGAELELLATVDGDGQFNIDELATLLRLQREGDADLVGGIRADRHDSWVRRGLGVTYNQLMRWVTETDWADLDCGFKLGRRARLRALDLRCDGNLVGAELYAKADRAGLRILQVPVEHRPRVLGRAKGADAFAIAGAAVEFVRCFDVLRPPR